jgi:cell division protein FtsZ
VKAAPVRSEAAPLTPAAPPRLSMPAPAEPAPKPVVRDDVVLTPAQPKPAMAYEAPAVQQPQAYDEEALEQGAFIPPQAERAVRPARMPRIDELPMPAQAQMRARSGEPVPSQEQKPSLIQRLATIGFGRKDEPHHGPAEQQPAQRPAPQAQPAPSSVHAEYAKQRPAPQGYRPAPSPLAAPVQRHMEDDQLEIPAFLRRQAN